MRLAGEKLPCQRAIGSPVLERVPRWPFFCFNFRTACVPGELFFFSFLLGLSFSAYNHRS